MASADAPVDYRQSHFEFPVLSKIIGEPTYEMLLLVLNELKANAQTVHSTLGGGAHGYLGLLVSAPQYALISGTPFVMPLFPPPLVFPLGATIHMINSLQQQHRDSFRVFRECRAVEAALKQQLVQALDKVYLASLRDSTTNSISRPLRGILTHLFDTYGKVTSQKIADEQEKVQNFAFDPVQPVDSVYTLIENLQILADAGHAPFTEIQLLNFAKNIINKTRKFKSEIKVWNRLPGLNQTWVAFKAQFRVAQQELRETDDLRIEDTFHHANMVQEIVSGISEAMQRNESNSYRGSDDNSFADTIVPSHFQSPPQANHLPYPSQYDYS